MKRKLLIVDDDTAILDTLKKFFTEKGMQVFLGQDSPSGLECVKMEHPQVALIDISLPQKSGIELLEEIKGIDPHLRVIMMSGNVTTQNAIAAMKYGAYDYLTKPMDPNKLEVIINKAFQSSNLTREIRIIGATPPPADEDDTDVMIGSSPEMLEIWKMIGQISGSDVTVLVQGESGTGKELLARSIYNNSRRKNKPFLAVNCAALPDNLLESELFGHEKGAFTDASSRHIGRFEQCTGGTIFLDEIAEMSLKSQAKLLRVLENQEFERVGGNESIKVDVRIIAATNRSLINAVKEKSFRMDLFYRLKVAAIFLPPLRERSEDIPLLVNFFIKKASQENRKSLMKLSPAAMKILLSYPWTGNIRELKNVINSAIVFSKGDTLLPEDFESLLYGKQSGTESVARHSAQNTYAMFQPLFEDIALNNEGAVFESFIAQAEEALFRLAMAKQKNNEVHAAKFLGISRNTLRQRLKLYKI